MGDAATRTKSKSSPERRPYVGREDSSNYAEEDEAPRGLLGRVMHFLVNNQITVPANILWFLITLHLALPTLREYTTPFISISYPPGTREGDESGSYGKGRLDLCYVFTWVMVFTGLRGVLMKYVFVPGARVGGVRGVKAQTRFGEQAWTFMYYAVAWSLGFRLVYNSDYLTSLHNMWAPYPNPLPAELKRYYLLQLAFWIHQLIVLHLERARRDHYAMLLHHLITLALMSCSYTVDVTRVGNMILVTMDFADILLPAAKMMKYLNWSKSCDFLFVCFLLAWLVTRHILFPTIIWSAAVQAPQIMEPVWDTEKGIYWMHEWFVGFVGLLGVLQVIICWWFWLILKVAYKVVRGEGAEDNRSDSEDEGQDNDEGDDEEINGKVNGSAKSNGVEKDVQPARRRSKRRKDGDTQE
ncbi:Sphingosine N-acyltransferase lag1 [Saitoella coloradoensis]